LTDVLGPSDSINFLPAPDVGSSPSAQGLTEAIDQMVGGGDKYLNFGLNGGQPFLGPIGFIDQPALGRTFVSGVRLYCADDTAGPGGRDPADFELFGSLNGRDWTKLYQNLAVNMPVGRNDGAVSALDPETNFLQQFLFSNTVSYSWYMWTVTNVQSDANNNSMQIGEVELLGTQDTSGAPGVLVPAFARAYNGTSVQIAATVSGTPTPTIQWQADGGTGVFTNITDVGPYTGSTALTLNIGPVGFAQGFNYQAVVSNSVGSVTSAIVPLTILLSYSSVCDGSDVIYTWGDNGLGASSPNSANGGVDDVGNAIDGTTALYINNGSGPNAGAGFVPFAGPCGFVVLPSAASGLALTPTLVQGIRIWSGQNSIDDDPADVELYGSVTGETNATSSAWQLIEATPLNLPLARTAAAVGLNALTDPIQEVDFDNNSAYTSYKVQFSNDRDNAEATSMQVAEVQLLGFQVGITSPVLSLSSSIVNGAGTLTITSTGAGELQSATDLNGPWANVEAISGNVTITVTPTPVAQFYRVIPNQ